MNAQTLNTFYHRLKQTGDNHKPYRHRNTPREDNDVAAKMLITSIRRKARDKHKRVISIARKRRGSAEDLGH